MLLQRCFTTPSPHLLPPHDVRTSTLLPNPWSPCTGIYSGPNTRSLQAVADPFHRLEAFTSTSTFLSPWGVPVGWWLRCLCPYLCSMCAGKWFPSGPWPFHLWFPAHILLEGSPSWCTSCWLWISQSGRGCNSAASELTEYSIISMIWLFWTPTQSDVRTSINLAESSRFMSQTWLSWDKTNLLSLCINLSKLSSYSHWFCALFSFLDNCEMTPIGHNIANCWFF